MAAPTRVEGAGAEGVDSPLFSVWDSPRKDMSTFRRSAAVTAIGAFGLAVLIAFLALTSDTVPTARLSVDSELANESENLQSTMVADSFNSADSEPYVHSDEPSTEVVKGPGGHEFKFPHWYMHHGVHGQEESSPDDHGTEYSSKAATTELAEMLHQASVPHTSSGELAESAPAQVGKCRQDCLTHDEACSGDEALDQFMMSDCCDVEKGPDGATMGKVAVGIMSPTDATCQSLGDALPSALGGVADAVQDAVEDAADDAEGGSEDDEEEEQEFQPQRDYVEVNPVETKEFSGPSWENRSPEQPDIAETAYSPGDGGDVIPGASFLGYGYDGKQQCTFEQCATLPVVQYTFDKKRTVTTPAGKFAVPDQMRVINQYETTAKTEVFSSFEQVESAFSAQASVSGSSTAFSGSASASYSSAASETNENWYSNRKLDVRLYSLDVRVDDLEKSTNPAFFADVKSLPLRFLDSPRAFLKFIQKWGPFVVLDAAFGGTLEVTMVTSKSVKESSSTISAAMEAEYNGIMASGKGSASMSASSAEKKVQENSMVGMLSNGGDPAVARVITDVVPGVEKPLFRADFEAWLNSISHFPRAISTVPKLTEIYKLVPTDSEDMQSRRNALQIAAAIYVGDKTASTHNMECHPDGAAGELQGTNGPAEGGNGKHQSQVDKSIVWANYNRISPNECLRFAARGDTGISVVMASVVSRPETWYRIKISRLGVEFYEGEGAKPVAESTNFGAAVMGSSTLFEDYWVCIFRDKIAYGKGPSEFLSWSKGKPLIPVRYYAFSCDSPTSFASIQIVNPNCQWMGSATEAFLKELDEDAGALQKSIETESVTLHGEGLQDNECHQWQCRTKVNGDPVEKNGEEWYPAMIKSSKELSCDVRHLQGVNPDGDKVKAFLEVGHRRRPLGSSKESDFETTMEYGWELELNRCPGEADTSKKPYRWVSCDDRGTCAKRAGGDFQCSCPGKWYGNTCDKCGWKCIGASPTDACNACKTCAGFRDESAGCACNARSLKEVSANCLQMDNSCHFCSKCKAGYSGGRCEFSYRWHEGTWTSCKTPSQHACGYGTRTRKVTCEEKSPKKGWTETSASKCTTNGRTKPTTSESCYMGRKCGYKWREWAWSGASSSCGSYTQTRTVRCVANWNINDYVGFSYCSGRQPPTSQTVNTGVVCQTAMDFRPTQYVVAGVSSTRNTAKAPSGVVVSGGGYRKSGWNYPLRYTAYVGSNSFKVGDYGQEVSIIRVSKLGECKLKSAPSNNVYQNSLSCDSGYTIVGGACQTNTRIGSMYPDTSGNKFVCGTWKGDTSNRGSVTTSAMCCQTKHIRSGCKWVSSRKWNHASTTYCPPNYDVYGGGCQVELQRAGVQNVEIMSSKPVKQGWFCDNRFENGQSWAYINAYAYCCPKV